MKKLFFSFVLLCCGMSLAGAQELLTFGGYHTQLYGYSDRRYVDADKGDYLKSLAYYAGSEFVQRGFDKEDELLKNIVLGGGVLLYSQNGFDSRTLYAVNGGGKTYNQETIPTNPSDRAARFQLIASGFGGYQSEWWGAEGGLSVLLKGEEEKVRKKYDATGTVVEAEGRGWVFGDGSLILPNLRLRAGREDLPHFVVSFYRGNFDPGYGALQARVILPLHPAFNLQVGGSLFQTSSVFLEPTLVLGGYSVSLRAGTILNYNDSAFTRVGIFEGAFVSGSVGVHW